MRYKVQIIDNLFGWLVTVTDYTNLSAETGADVRYFTIERNDVKVADMQHLFGEVHRLVSESTP